MRRGLRLLPPWPRATPVVSSTLTAPPVDRIGSPWPAISGPFLVALAHGPFLFPYTSRPTASTSVNLCLLSMSGNDLSPDTATPPPPPPTRRALNILGGDTGRRSGSGTRGSAMRPKPGSWPTAMMRPPPTPPTTDMDGQLKGMVMLTNLNVLMQASLNLHMRGCPSKREALPQDGI